MFFFQLLIIYHIGSFFQVVSTKSLSITAQRLRNGAILIVVALLILLLHILTCIECTLIGTVDSLQNIFNLLGGADMDHAGVGILVRKYQVRTPGN